MKFLGGVDREAEGSEAKKLDTADLSGQLFRALNMSTQVMQAPPASHTRRYLAYLKQSHSYGSLAAEIQFRFSQDKTFSFSTLIANPRFRALPAPFKAALRRLYAELVKAHKSVQAYEGLQPQAAFERATRLSEPVTNVTVHPFALVFTMDWENFHRLQTANGRIANPFMAIYRRFSGFPCSWGDSDGLRLLSSCSYAKVCSETPNCIQAGD